MNLLVLSDLHIGNNDHFDSFGWQPEEFIRALEVMKFKEHIDKIVLNGDIFELYKYSFDEIKSSNKLIVDYLLNNKDVVYLKGNHDAICPFGQDIYRVENSKGKIIHIEHGHSADFMNGTHLGRKIQTLGFNLLRPFSKFRPVFNIYQKIQLMGEVINNIPKKYDSIRYLSYALRLLKHNDVVIMGHTHKIESHKTYYLNNKKLYINSGSCSMGRFQGVLIDTETLKHETFKFKNFNDLMKEYSKPLVVREFAMSA